MSAKRKLILAIGIISLFALIMAALFVSVHAVEEELPERSQFEIHDYTVCHCEWGAKKDIEPPRANALAALCNRVVEEGHRLANESQDIMFEYESGENLTFFADKEKTQFAGKIQFWCYSPKRVRITTQQGRAHFDVPDELYSRIVAEVRWLEKQN